MTQLNHSGPCSRGKGFGFLATNHELHKSTIVRQVYEVRHGHCTKLLADGRRIERPNPKRHHAANVPHNCFKHCLVCLQEAFEANSSIKLAGGVSARDARALASQLSADPDMIQRQPKGSFATYIRGLTERAVPMSFPFFVLEKLPRASAERRNAIREYSRSHYAEPLPTSSTNAAENEPESMTKPNLSEPTDPTGLSPEL